MKGVYATERDCSIRPRGRIVRRVQLMLAVNAESLNQAMAIVLPCMGALAAVLALRAARFPLREISGRAIIAGAIAGILLGPSVLGRVLPEQFESIFIGGVAQRESLDYTRWLATNAPAAATSLTDEGRAAMIQDGARQVAQKQAALDAARAQYQQPMRLFAMSVVALALLASCARTVAAGDRRQGWLTPVSIGIWSWALPAAAAYMCAVRFWDLSIAEAALLAAALGIGPWALGAIEREVADDAEFGGARMMQSAGRIASILAMVLALWMGWRLRGAAGVLMLTPLMMLPLAWTIDFVRPRRRIADAKPRDGDDGWRMFPVEALLTIVATLVALKIDLHAPWTWAAVAMLIALPLIADDGRWLGAFLGALLPGGRQGLRTMRLVMPAMAAGPTQLAVAVLALHGGLLPERLALPLLAGAILIEITAPGRRHMAARLIETEQQIEDAD